MLIRVGPAVERVRVDSLDAALTVAEHRLAAAPRRAPVTLRRRSFAPERQVAGRAEISGPGARGGVDVRGDGSAEAWVGRLRKRVVDPRPGETAYDALRRALTA